MVGRGDNKHNRSYTIRITKTGHIIIRNSKHIKSTCITTEQYLKDQLIQHTKDPLGKNEKNIKHSHHIMHQIMLRIEGGGDIYEIDSYPPG